MPQASLFVFQGFFCKYSFPVSLYHPVCIPTTHSHLIMSLSVTLFLACALSLVTPQAASLCFGFCDLRHRSSCVRGSKWYWLLDSQSFAPHGRVPSAFSFFNSTLSPESTLVHIREKQRCARACPSPLLLLMERTGGREEKQKE